jgi:hypothetical protein
MDRMQAPRLNAALGRLSAQAEGGELAMGDHAVLASG